MTYSKFRWAVATTLARWSKYRLYGLFKALLALSVVVGVAALAANKAYNLGIDKGVDMYHKMCYHNGPGYIVGEAGTVVACGPVTVLPEQERKFY